MSDPFTAIDAMRDVHDTLAADGFAILRYRRGERDLVYRAHTGEHIRLIAIKQRGR